MTVYMKESSTFIYGDIITPGWSESGELFRYDWIRSKLKIYYEDNLKLFDHLYLETSTGMTGIFQMEGYTHFGSLFVISPFMTQDLLQKFESMAARFPASVHLGLSIPMIPGLVIRVLAMKRMLLKRFFK